MTRSKKVIDVVGTDKTARVNNLCGEVGDGRIFRIQYGLAIADRLNGLIIKTKHFTRHGMGSHTIGAFVGDADGQKNQLLFGWREICLAQQIVSR